MDHDTIAAIATPPGEGGIAVIRVSGSDAIRETEKVFRSKRKLSAAETHTVHYGHIVRPDTGERIEEVLVTVMRAPRSFTMEDVIEVSCHGGIVSVRKVLELLLEQDIRLAEPGEFTKRAFLNGRIDLSQAEAVIDLIRAKSDRAFRIALKQADGTLSRKIKALRHRLVELMAHIEVNIDYPEHDVEEMTNTFIKDRLREAMAEMDDLLRSAQQGKIIREGLTTAIIGRPNVGKSSLLNALAHENKAIVTDVPGTTRDVIEEFVSVGGIPLRLLDTAGIRETSDIVEKIGVERSRTALEEADLVLLVLAGNEALLDEEKEWIRHLQGRPFILVVNKADLPQHANEEELRRLSGEAGIVRISAQEHTGMEQLEQSIADLFFGGKIESDDSSFVSNARHIQLLKKARQSADEAMQAAEQFVPIDMIQIDIRNAWELLGEIIGDSVGESLIDQIFTQFCLGK